MMRKLAILTAAAALLVVPAASHAQVILGARLGYALGMGDVGGDSSGTLHMSDHTKSQVPIQLEALFKVGPQWAIGPYFSYGWAQAGGDAADACDTSGIDCSARIMRLGVEAIYTFPNKAQFVPWLGAGIGYEWSKFRIEGGGESADLNLSGWEFLNLQGGGDWKLSPKFKMGPFAQLSFAQYSNQDVSTSLPGGGASGDIPEKKVHEWFQIGVRGSFDL